MLDVRRATLPERVLQLGHRWTAVSHHYGVDIVATRNFSRTDSRTLELLASLAIQWKMARERAKAKEKEERANKEKERANSLDLVSIHFGDRHLATCRIGTRTVTQSVQRCGL